MRMLLDAKRMKMLSEQDVSAVRGEEQKRVLEGPRTLEADAAPLRETRISRQA